MYTVYILQCSDNSLYTGITTELERRLEQHRTAKGSKYVWSRCPFRLLYTEEFPDRSSASKREFALKQWPREKKIADLGLKL